MVASFLFKIYQFPTLFPTLILQFEVTLGKLFYKIRSELRKSADIEIAKKAI